MLHHQNMLACLLARTLCIPTWMRLAYFFTIPSTMKQVLNKCLMHKINTGTGASAYGEMWSWTLCAPNLHTIFLF